MMSKQGQYLFVKQKLDSYKLPTIFPIQMMPLLLKLIQKLDDQIMKNNKKNLQQIINSGSGISQFELSYKHVDKALKTQLSRVMHENNQLHIDIITLKQQLQSTNHFLDKQVIQKSDNKQQIKQILQFKNQKQSQLIQQLQIVKFKYNQLLDFINEEDNLERSYIKKLFNHKKFDTKHYLQEKQELNHNENLNHTTFKDKRNINESLKGKQPRKRINKTLQHDHKHNSHFETSNKLHFIQQKLQNRQNQIQRLHAIISYDGLNLNKVMFQYNQDGQRKKYNEMQERLSLLENENARIKKQLDKSKKTGGRYQALKQEVSNCHETIKQLKHENKNIKRSKRQNDFDIQNQRKQISKFSQSFNTKTVQMKVTKFSDDLTIEQLKKKVQFYESQLGNLPKQQKEVNKKVSKKVLSKNTKKSIMKLKQQAQQNNSSHIRQRYQDRIKLTKINNKKAHSKIKQKNELLPKNQPIRQISQQSDQQSSERHQKKNSKDKNQIEQNQRKLSKEPQLNQKNQDQQRESEEQESEESENEQQQNQTLNQQYQQTIQQLTTKVMTLKQQLELKNQSIVTLEQIVNKLMKSKEQKSNNQPNIDHSPNQKDKKMSDLQKQQISKLSKQVKSLSGMLNESQFQKEELRRQVIQMQQLYKRINLKNEEQIGSEQQLKQQFSKRLDKSEESLLVKQKKIQELRRVNVEIQERLIKSLDRIKRLNDEIQGLANEKQQLQKKLGQIQKNLEAANVIIREQRQHHSNTIELNQLQKDEIILLRQNLVLEQNRVIELQSQLIFLQQQNKVLKNRLDLMSV